MKMGPILLGVGAVVLVGGIVIAASAKPRVPMMPIKRLVPVPKEQATQ